MVVVNEFTPEEFSEVRNKNTLIKGYTTMIPYNPNRHTYNPTFYYGAVEYIIEPCIKNGKIIKYLYIGHDEYLCCVKHSIVDFLLPVIIAMFIIAFSFILSN